MKTNKRIISCILSLALAVVTVFPAFSLMSLAENSTEENRTSYKFDFDSYADDFGLGAKAENGCTLTLSNDKSYSGNTSLKFEGKKNNVATDANVRLDRQSGYDSKIKVGTTYVVSFKYFVDSEYAMQFYYNFAADVYQNDTLNVSTEAKYGYQMINGNYAASKQLGGTKADGWQTETIQFTVRKGENTKGANPDELILCLRSLRAVGVVYIDDVTVTELFAAEYAVNLVTNGGEPIEPMIKKNGETVESLPTAAKSNNKFSYWCSDRELTKKVSAVTFGAETTPVTDYVPYTLYAKYKESLESRTTAFDFDSYADDFELGAKAENGCALTLSQDKVHSGNTSLKFEGKTNGAVADANVRLDRQSGYDTKIKLGSTYVVSFKYYVDSDAGAQFYYNFAADIYQTESLNTQTQAEYGWQMVADSGYAFSRPLTGTKADGWQTVTVQFTVRKGAQTTAAKKNQTPDRLILCLRSYKAIADVYIDDITATEIYSDEYAVCYNTAGGNQIDYRICDEGEKVYIPESPVRNSDVFENWYTDSNYESVYTERTCNAENTPVTEYVPFTLYAKFIAAVPKLIDFENFDISKTVYGTSNKESSIAISNANKYAGNSALEVTSTATSNSKAVTKNIILLKAGDQKVKLNRGKSYVISFKYFVESEYPTTTYYNYVLRNSNSYGNVLESTTKANGIMMYNEEGYQAAIPLSGTSTNGWQSSQAAFTATASDEAKTYLYLYVQTKSPCKVYIDNIEIIELEKNQNMVQFKSDGSFVAGRITGERGTQFTLPTVKREGFKFIGWYYDEKFEKPANNIHPDEGVTTLYAKWESSVTVVNSIDFENWNYKDAVYKTTESPKSSLEFTNSKAHSGKTAMKFTSFAQSTDKPAAKAAIVLSDGETKCQVNKGKNYLVSFWYYVDAEYDSQIYYNFVTTSSSSVGNVLLSTVQKNGVQLYNSEGYAASQKLYGASSAGWQKAVCIFTASTTTDAKNFLAFYIQANKVSTSVYIDDFSIEEVSDDVGVVVFMANGGKSVEPIIGKIGQTVSLPSCEPLSSNSCFAGWHTDVEGKNKVEKVTLVKEPTVLYSKFVFGYTKMDFDDGYCYADRKKYPMAISKEGENLEWYTPKTENYDSANVHSGKNSIHRFYQNDDEHSVLSVMNVSDYGLTVGEEYTLRYWVKCTSMFAKDSYMQISYGTDRTNGWNRIANAEVPNICKVKKIGTDEWVQVSFTFTAKANSICFRTMGANELYFDDFELMWSKYPGYDKFVNEATVKCVESEVEIETIGFDSTDDGSDEIFAGNFKLSAAKVDDNTESSNAYIYIIAGIAAGVLVVGGITFAGVKKAKRNNKASK